MPRRRNLFIELPVTFGDIEAKILAAIREKLIQRHRNHKGFSITKSNVIECDQCEFSAEETDKGYIALENGIIKYLVGVDISAEQIDWIANMTHTQSDDDESE